MAPAPTTIDHRAGRRRLLRGLGGLTAAWPLLSGPSAAHAQVPDRVYRLGHLSVDRADTARRPRTLTELARLGFIEGRNLVFEGRSGTPDALPRLMGELLATRPDAVWAVGIDPALAAAAATRTVPIVVYGADPVGLGFAQSYARPGGNVTGVVILTGELDVKRLSILREALPDRRRMAALLSPAQRPIIEPPLLQAAAGLGVELHVFSAATPEEYPAAFAAMRAAGAEALLIGAGPEFARDVRQLAALALEARLPTACQWADMTRDGCMIGYGPSRIALRRRVAQQLAMILRGTPPGEVAIERPAVFELALNQRVARSLGVSLPVTVLAGADEVFE